MRREWLRRRAVLIFLAVVIAVAGALSTQLGSAPEVDLPASTTEEVAIEAPEESVAEADTDDRAQDGILVRTAPSGSAASGGAGQLPEDRVIVKFDDTASEAQKRRARTEEQAEKIRDLALVRAEVVRAKGRSAEATARALNSRPDVEYAEPDYVVRVSAYQDEPYFDYLWGLNNSGQSVQGQSGAANLDIDALEASAVSLGSTSLTVAVIDDGVDFSHPDLSGRQWANPGESGTDSAGKNRATNGVDDDLNGYVDDVNGWDFYNGDKTVHDAVDKDNHGTHVAGTIAASLNGKGVVGVAPNVKVMALKFIGPQGGYTSDAISAIQYVTRKGVVISNNSWGGPGYSQALKDAIESSGQLFVAAAGNASKNQDTGPDPDYPAAFDSSNILSVAAVDNAGSLASFSNYGATSVDISAPGVNILSTIPKDYNGTDEYAFYSGTSMAAPHATGIAALFKSVRPSLTVPQIKTVILDSGKAATNTTGRTLTGKVARVDITRPVAKAPVQVFVSNSTLGTSAVPVRLSWSASDGSGSGVVRYQLQQSTNGGSYATVSLPSATTTVITRSLTPGYSYRFRVRAYDRAGNLSAFATGPGFTVDAFQESSAKVSYGGSWTGTSLSGAYGGAVRYAGASGVSAKLSFTGRNVAFAAPKSSTRGKADIYVDGTKVTTVDLYSTTTLARRVLYAKAWTASGTHTIEVRALGTSGRPRVDLDAFVVLR